MTRQMHVSLFLLLLWFLFLQLCSTSGILAEPSGGVVRELPRKGESGVQAYTVATTRREFIRIVASYEDLTEGKYCTKEGSSIPDFSGKNVNCGDYYYFLTKERIPDLINTAIPAAIKLHADRLLVDRVSGPLKVPEFKEDSICRNFTVPSKHHSEGVNDADMVVYVAARPVTPFGVPCAYDSESGRPIAGAINILSPTYRSLRYSTRRIAHEMAHALGFDYDVLKENKMVSESRFKDGEERVLVVSRKTKEKAQEHYGCSTVEGMELAYTGKKTVSSHWNYRVAKDDLMGSKMYTSGMYYTALTMAVFDGLPYYSANWGMEEPMSWGKNSGCYLLDYDYKEENPSEYPPGMFCSVEKPVYVCTTDRFALGNCDRFLSSYNSEGKEIVVGTYTPRYDIRAHSNISTVCNSNPRAEVPGSVFAYDSMCLDTDEYKVNLYEAYSTMYGMCAQVSCDGDKVRVKYDNISDWKECPENSKMAVNVSDSLTITLKCPKYSEVCTIAPNGSSRLPLVVPPVDVPTESPGTGDQDSSSETAGDESSSGTAGDQDSSSETAGDESFIGGDGCVAAALFAPLLLLVMVLTLLLHE